MIEAFDVVELLVDLPDAVMEHPDAVRLHAGDRGTVVDSHPDYDALTVEFMRDGETVALTYVESAQVRVVWRAQEQREG